MRFAVSTSSAAGALGDGSTQLEWIERVARNVGADGIVLDVATFPRVDDEYVAQVRKVAIDLGLELLALDIRGPADAAEAIALARSAGAPLVRLALDPPGPVPPESFVAAVAEAKTLARAAKAANVTLAIATQPGTLGATLADVRHLIKDVDSAWLRYAVRVPHDDTSVLTSRDRVVLRAVDAQHIGDDAIVALAQSDGPVVVDARTPLALSALAEAVAELRERTFDRRSRLNTR